MEESKDPNFEYLQKRADDAAPVGKKGVRKHMRAYAKAVQALELRVQGLSYQQIAERVGWKNKASVSYALQSLLARIPCDDAATYRRIELERLEQLHRAVWPAAAAGEPNAIDTALKISRARCQLLGLNAAQKMEVAAVVDSGPSVSEAIQAMLTDGKAKELSCLLAERIRDIEMEQERPVQLMPPPSPERNGVHR